LTQKQSPKTRLAANKAVATLSGKAASGQSLGKNFLTIRRAAAKRRAAAPTT